MSSELSDPLATRIARLEENYGRLNPRLERLEWRTNEENRYSEITDLRLSSIDKRMDSLEQSMTVLSDTVTALSNTVTFQLGEQNRRLEAFEQRIISVDGSLNEFRKELEGKIDKANGRSLTIIGLMLTVATLVFTAVTYVFSTMPAGSTP